MKKAVKRLGCQRGESLLESLVSILIVALSTVLLLTAITSASKINLAVRKSDEEYFRQLRIAELGRGAEVGTLEVVIGSTTYVYQVDYAGENGHLRSYDKAVTP